LRKIQLNTGIRSIGRIGVPHVMQCEERFVNERSSGFSIGSLIITTFRKLPIQMPKRKIMVKNMSLKGNSVKGSWSILTKSDIVFDLLT
jgi:hypothetical protein